MRQRIVTAGRWALTAAHAGRYLWLVRAAIPMWLRPVFAVAMVIKCIPFIDFGTDEVLIAVGILLLVKVRPGLVQACWEAASQDRKWNQ